MNFIEVLLLIDQRGEKITSDKIHAIHTDKFLYERGADGVWVQKDLPPPIQEEDKFPPLPEPEVVPKKKKK